MKPLAEKCSTAPEVAERLRVGHEKVLAWIRSGQLVATNVATRPDARPRWVVSEAELQRFLDSRSSQPALPVKTPRRRTPPLVKSFF